MLYIAETYSACNEEWATVVDTDDWVREDYSKKQVLNFAKQVKIRGVDIKSGELYAVDMLRFMKDVIKKFKLAGLLPVGVNCEETKDGRTMISSDTGVDGFSFSKLVIPKGIRIINKRAFRRNKLGAGALRTIQIEQGVEDIMEKAFEFCDSVERVFFPSSLNGIGECAFNCCSTLSQVVITGNLQFIDESAFSQCINLRSFEVYSSKLKKIGYACFMGCNSLESVIVSDLAGSVGREEQFVCLDRSCFKGCKNLRNVDLSSSNRISIIQEGCFNGCESLEIVKLPPRLTKMYVACFENCKSLRSVVIPDRVVILSDRAFHDCKSLKSVKLSKSLRGVDASVFAGCTSLESVELSESIECLDQSCFSGCVSLKSIKLPRNLTLLLSGCFSYSGLASIDIPQGVASISNRVFYACGNLKEVNLPSSVNELCYQSFAECTSLEFIHIPESVDMIDRECFKGCTSLKRLEMPYLCAIEDMDTVFDGCDSLECIRLLGNGNRDISCFKIIPSLKFIEVSANCNMIPMLEDKYDDYMITKDDYYRFRIIR